MHGPDRDVEFWLVLYVQRLDSKIGVPIGREGLGDRDKDEF